MLPPLVKTESDPSETNRLRLTVAALLALEAELRLLPKVGGLSGLLGCTTRLGCRLSFKMLVESVFRSSTLNRMLKLRLDAAEPLVAAAIFGTGGGPVDPDGFFGSTSLDLMADLYLPTLLLNCWRYSSRRLRACPVSSL